MYFCIWGNKDSAIYYVSRHALKCLFYFPQSAAFFTSLSLFLTKNIQFFLWRLGKKINPSPLPCGTAESRILACNMRFKGSKSGMPVIPKNCQRKIPNFIGQKAGMCNKPSKKIRTKVYVCHKILIGHWIIRTLYTAIYLINLLKIFVINKYT